ncbi:MAG TPA: tyrosine-type recombinase/integrase [Herpetosiphonaceae bacterium]
MPASEQLKVAIDEWLVHLEDKQQSEHTLAAQRYAMTLFEQWLDTRSEPIDLSALTASLLMQYINDTKHRPPTHSTDATADGQRLKHSTIHRYIDILVRWLQYLIDEGMLPGIPKHRSQKRVRLLTPEGVRATLKQLIERNPSPVAPRMPDLSQLPDIYHHAVLQLDQRTGSRPPLDTPSQRRTYLNLLRNRALIATLFCTGGRIREVLSLDVPQVMPDGAILDEVPIVGKGRKARPLPLDRLAQTWIGDYLIMRAELFPGTHQPLFISHGPHGSGQRLTAVSAWRIVKAAAQVLADRRLGDGASAKEVEQVRAISPHSLRHYFAQTMLDRGAGYDPITAVLGHSSRQVTETVYARMSDEQALAAVKQFGPQARLSPPPDPDA